MSLLSQASLVVVPSGYKEDVVYSVKPTDGSGDLTFTRASDGTRVNSQGLVERVPWNLAQYSEDLSNAAWTKTNATITTNAATAPNGTLTADKYDGTNATNDARQTITTANGAYTFSIYVKKDATDVFRMNLSDGVTGEIRYLFNLSTEAETLTKSGGTISDYSAGFQSVGGGWYRLHITATTNSGTSIIAYFEADNQTGSYFVWGAQLNEGTLKPYFPTTDRLDVPRLDYSNGCPSLLLEPQRTNLALYSEDCSNGIYALSNGLTVTSNTTTAPDGTLTADTLTGTSSNGSIQGVVGVTIGQVYTMSVYLKRKTGTGTIQLRGVSNTSTTVSITNEWARYSVTLTAVDTNGRYGVLVQTSGDEVYAWGFQLEAGSYPTSYIPTTSASVTRVVDAAYKTGISSLIGQTEGVLYIELEGVNYSPTGGAQFCSIDDGTSLKRMELFANTSNLIGVYVQDVIAQVNFTSAVPATGRIKIALAYKLNDYALYVNGNLVHTDTNGTVPTVSALRLFGRYDGLANGSQAVNQAALFKTRLTNAELASLTTL